MIRFIPLIGELRNSSKESLISALKETCYSTAFSTVPIWFFPTFSVLFLTDKSTFGQAVYSSVNQGDLYIYASSLVGPLIFAITSNYASWNEQNPSPSASKLGKLTFAFPYGTWFFIISLAVCVLAGMCFGMVRFSSAGIINAELKSDNLYYFSICIYLFSNFCLFCVSVYRNDLSSGRISNINETKNFLDAWNNRNE